MSDPTHALNIKLQDGALLVLHGEDMDALRATSFAPAGAGDARAIANDSLLVGFGPWPGWNANVTNRVATLPDADSGMFEPERLFVLREQYVFLAATDADRAKPLSLGPIHKAWWTGTENVVQARQAGARH